MYYLNVFFIGSFIGYVLETSLKYLFFHSMNNGILFGPWIPVYGFGMVIIVFISKFIFCRFKLKTFNKLLLFFIFNVLIITILEFSAGVLIEKVFNKVFWSYDSYMFNFGHYICLEVSLLWGILSLLVIYFIKPIEDFIIKKIPRYITILVLIVFLIDFIITFQLI